MKFTEILKKNRELGSQLSSEKYRIAVISNITLFQIKEILECSLRMEGINAEVAVGDYDAIVQDSSKFSDVNAIIIFWEPVNFIDGLHYKAYMMDLENLENLAAKVESEIQIVIENLSKIPLVLINQFCSVSFDQDVIRKGPIKQLSIRLNAFLEKSKSANTVIVDLQTIFSSISLSRAIDIRQFQSSKALYSVDFFRNYSEAVKPVFMAANGKTKKVLILDCDNTLWGGILGEDGDSGILMNPLTSRGKIFHEVQTIISGLKKQGVLLAICSKNNATDVEKIIANHADMILRLDDFVIKRINWDDKAKNIREIARELNLGLDSFVFVDDSPFEIGLIEKQLPEVKCVRVPENLSQYPEMIDKLRLDFFSLSKSDEDARKTAMYQEEQKRKTVSDSFDTIDDYLKSLGLCIKILWGNEVPVSRVAQLTNKTNQFNLTTRRYTEVEIQNMLSSSGYKLAVFEVSDNYGDYGVTGLVIIKIDPDSGNQAVIDSFLMSCRVIGRKIEEVFFDEIISVLKNSGVTKLDAEYITTHKNSQVAQLYDQLGFSLITATDQSRKYEMELLNYQPRNITYIKKIA